MWEWLKKIWNTIINLIHILDFKVHIERLGERVKRIEGKTLFDKPVEDCFNAFSIKWLKFQGNKYYEPYCPIHNTILKMIADNKSNPFSLSGEYYTFFNFCCHHENCKFVSESMTPQEYDNCKQGKVER